MRPRRFSRPTHSPRNARLEIRVDGKPVRIGGMAKGAGMIMPNLATMLAFITTDAAVAPATLRRMLARAAGVSFNRVTVDSDTSTTTVSSCLPAAPRACA